MRIAPAAFYYAEVTIIGDLERARHLALAAQEESAKEILLALLAQVEEADRDDLACEVLAQLAEIYLVRTAYDGVVEGIRRIRECLDAYTEIRAGRRPDLAGRVTMSEREIDHLVCRYTRRTEFLAAGLAAANGDHAGAAAHLRTLIETAGDFEDLAGEHRGLICHARILIARGLCDDDMYADSVPVWTEVLGLLDEYARRGDVESDHLFVHGALSYGRFCVETGRLDEAQPWLRRAEARAGAREWRLAGARAQLERAAARWADGDIAETQTLVHQAYPAIAEHVRAHDVSRSWLYFGLIRFRVGALDEADECWGHAERHWREIEKPLHIHRILLQRSWIAIMRGDFAAAVVKVAEARELLDSYPRHSWLQYARLDDQLGNIWRADALADLGLDPNTGTLSADPDSREYRSAMVKLKQAADLKVPAALAVDAVRYSISDAGARMRWARCVSAPLLAGAFAVAKEWENAALVSELIEYHSARGAFTTELGDDRPRPVEGAWSSIATAAVPVEGELALVAAAPPVQADGGLTRLGPLPPLRMDPAGDQIMRGYRELARQRYGREVTAVDDEWSTWP
ncbi:hypothetical protein D2E30_02655 [Mycobacteroides abscessus]|nr:hypothetical protein DDJ88_17710 [Mycobacteroides abscessus]PVA49129.1 hypothetical protein DDJ35_12860 [Mycobacteroides abscessus]RIQ89856.1 hypothetical protein D2E34_14310 [Mycobacteroides abscessus]RIR02202.1 hypothetical protein D2E30_02655 [Mycobacteroides abscessus]RIS00852.1 hypothetical protein D2E45_20040 [Mycobacteroides abscessus]